jgi:hypothetical protein
MTLKIFVNLTMTLKIFINLITTLKMFINFIGNIFYREYVYIKEIIKKRTKRIFHNILVLTFSLLLQIFRYNVYKCIYIWIFPRFGRDLTIFFVKYRTKLSYNFFFYFFLFIFFFCFLFVCLFLFSFWFFYHVQ